MYARSPRLLNMEEKRYGRSGFGCVVALPAGTNTPLEGEYEDKLLFRKNKWILSHVDNKALIDRGVVPGVTGINLSLIHI